MTDRNRRWALFFAGMAVVALAMLAAGLSGLELRGGQRLIGPRPPAAEESDPQQAIGSEILDTLLLVMGVLTLLLLPLAILLLLASRDARQRLRRLLGLLLLLGLAALLARANHPASPPPPQTLARSTPLPGPTPSLETPGQAGGPALDLTVNPPAWLVWLTAGLLALFVVGLIAGTAWLVVFRGRLAPGPLEQLAGPVEEAIERLEAGAEVGDTVLRCYFDMARLLDEQRGVTRAEAMTPREFERQLCGAGLPAAPVAQLTRLFEQARYGSAPPDAGRERQAVECLAAIARACQAMP